MSHKLRASEIDFDFGIGDVIPSTQEAYQEGFKERIRKEEKELLSLFKGKLSEDLNRRLSGNGQFPTEHEVFVFIMQYFAAEKEYDRRDIDNMAKTVLDVLNKKFYQDDSQVKTLLVGKKMADGRVYQNFAYVAIKELRGGQDVDALKISGLERSVTFFQELKSKGIL